MHLKFASQLISKNNLWTKFFKAKYVKDEHWTYVKPRPIGSRFWKVICNVIPEVYEHNYTRIRESNVSFQFNYWLGTGTLADSGTDVTQSKLKV